jgi:predicted enzyme related to lactoylglutathione lyase
MLDLQVDSAVGALNAVAAAGATVVLGEPEVVHWGERVIVLDPDGREVQLHQSS